MKLKYVLVAFLGLCTLNIANAGTQATPDAAYINCVKNCTKDMANPYFYQSCDSGYNTCIQASQGQNQNLTNCLKQWATCVSNSSKEANECANQKCSSQFPNLKSKS